MGAAIAISATAPADAYWNRYPGGWGPPAGYMDYQYRPAPRYAPRHAPRRVLRRPVRNAKPDPVVTPPKGPLILAISITQQHIKVYDAGVLIAQAPVSTGTPSHPTPTGVFSVIEKQRWHRSNLYSGAPMPHMQRITWSGVALHGGILPGYPASHGCIRLPFDFAARLFGMTRKGARVVVTRDDVAPADLEHARLAALRKPAPPASGSLPPADQTVRTAAAEGPVTDAPAVAAPEAKSDAAPSELASPLPAGEPAKAGEPGDAPPAELRKSLDAVEPAAPIQPKLRAGPVSVFVSRKEGKLFVRKGFEPLFDIPVTIARPDLPLGTHVFTATAFRDDGTMQWLALSMPTPAKGASESGRRKQRAAAETHDPHPLPTAAEALDRIEWPKDALDRISGLLSPGASLIVSDQGLGAETGRETDFIVLTR
jgi:lipoprotein-anchoring transpeptidase ErfK/SrfK